MTPSQNGFSTRTLAELQAAFWADYPAKRLAEIDQRRAIERDGQPHEQAEASRQLNRYWQEIFGHTEQAPANLFSQHSSLIQIDYVRPRFSANIPNPWISRIPSYAFFVEMIPAETRLRLRGFGISQATWGLAFEQVFEKNQTVVYDSSQHISGPLVKVDPFWIGIEVYGVRYDLALYAFCQENHPKTGHSNDLMLPLVGKAEDCDG